MKIASIGANKMNSFQGVLKPVDVGSKVSFKGNDEVAISQTSKNYQVCQNALSNHYQNLIAQTQEQSDKQWNETLTKMRVDFWNSELEQNSKSYKNTLKSYADFDLEENIRKVVSGEMRDKAHDNIKKRHFENIQYEVKKKYKNALAELSSKDALKLKEQMKAEIESKFQYRIDVEFDSELQKLIEEVKSSVKAPLYAIQDEMYSLFQNGEAKSVVIVSKDNPQFAKEIFDFSKTHNQATGILGTDTLKSRYLFDFGYDFDYKEIIGENDVAQTVLDEIKHADENFKTTGRKTVLFVNDAKSIFSADDKNQSVQTLMGYVKGEDKLPNVQLVFSVDDVNTIPGAIKDSGRISVCEIKEPEVSSVYIKKLQQNQQDIKLKLDELFEPRKNALIERKNADSQIHALKDEFKEKTAQLNELRENDMFDKSHVDSFINSIGISPEEFTEAQHKTNWQNIKEGTAQVVSFSEAEVKEQTPSLLSRAKGFIKTNKVLSVVFAAAIALGTLGLLAKNSKNKAEN